MKIQSLTGELRNRLALATGRVWRVLGQIRKAPSASTAMQFALILPAALAAMAVTLDFGRLLVAKNKLAGVADAAVISAVSKTVYDPGLSTDDQTKVSKGVALSLFKSQAPADVTIESVAFDLKRSGLSITATISYSASLKSTFGEILFPKMTITSYATSTVASTFVNVLLLVDSSQSMGLGADAVTQSKMMADSRVGYCALACHSGGGGDTVVAAHSAGYRLRIDVVKDAIASVLNGASSARNVVKSGIYTFNDEFTVASPLSANFAKLKSDASALDIAVYGAGTSINYGLKSMLNYIGTPGDGSAADKPLTFVIFISDGVNNTVNNTSKNWTTASTAYPPFDGKACWAISPPPNSGPYFPPTGPVSALPCVPDPWTPQHGGNGGMELMPIDPAWCDQLKTRGAKVMTLYTQYVLSEKATTDPWLFTTADWRLPLMQQYVIPKIRDNMVACASNPGFAYSASDPTSIQSAIADMFSKAINSTPRITQ